MIMEWIKYNNKRDIFDVSNLSRNNTIQFINLDF